MLSTHLRSLSDRVPDITSIEEYSLFDLPKRILVSLEMRLLEQGIFRMALNHLGSLKKVQRWYHLDPLIEGKTAQYLVHMDGRPEDVEVLLSDPEAFKVY